MFGMTEQGKVGEYVEDGWYLPLDPDEGAHYMRDGSSLCGNYWLLGVPEGSSSSERCEDCVNLLAVDIENEIDQEKKRRISTCTKGNL